MKISRKPVLGALDYLRERAVRRFSLSLISAALMAVLGSFAFFEHLESITYRLSASMELPFISNDAALAVGPETIPRVLLISSDMYEKVFQQVSPLDRGTLAAVFASVLAGKPALLAADLDVSPTLAAAVRGDAGQARLDQLLLLAARHMPIVLATPSPVESPALRRLKFAWMQTMCRGGVVFGVPSLHAADGMVLRYRPDQPGFSQVAAGLVPGRGAAPQGSKWPREASACEKVAGGRIENADFLDPAAFRLEEGAGPKGMQLLNANYFDGALESQISAFSSVAEIPGAPELAGRVVFLGGQYGIDERFETLNGERYGAVIHAAVFYSLTHPLREIPGWLRKLLDVLLGAVLGAVFEALWATYYANHLVYQALGGAETRDERIRRARAFGRSVMTLIGVLLASGALFWALLLASTVALKNGSQFSIAFMAFALFAYGVKGNRKGLVKAEISLRVAALRARLTDSANREEPLELLDRMLLGDDPQARPRQVRGFLVETASHLAAFLGRRWQDVRFIVLTLPSAPRAAFWATAELLTSLVPIVAVAWAVVASVVQ